MQQVRTRLEKQRRQYDLKERALALGLQRVVVIDEDLGRSGTGSVERLPARQIVKFPPWMIERTHLELPAVRKQIRRVHEGRRPRWAVKERQERLFTDSHEVQP
jgi:hypothetical protein